MRFLVFVLSVGWITSAHSLERYISKEECTEIDIRDKHPHLRGYFSKPREQKSLGWCYAHTAADLLSVEVGKPVSSPQMAAVHNQWKMKKHREGKLKDLGRRNLSWHSFKSDILVGGDSREVLENFKGEKVVCTEEEFPYSAASPFGRGLEGIIDNIEANKDSYRAGEFHVSLACENIVSELEKLKMFGKEVVHIASMILTDDINNALYNITQNYCGKTKEVVPDYKVQSMMNPLARNGGSFSDDETFKNIEKQKAKKFLDHISNTLKKGKPLVVDYWSPNFWKGDSTGHSSTIIARKWGGGRCHFKVRNSFGQKCNYKKLIECNESEGAFWVSDREMIEKTWRISNIEN
ncbi:MAG: hypothetical protein KC493_13995 [Bacteriovoracaceae bacterium]|nr:hypothetical protein [Bacteriovoracaceae bacterium]